MENSMKIRMFRDGTSVVIYIDDCTASMEEFLTGLLSPATAPESRLEKAEVIHEDPIVPEGCGSCSGKSISEILSEKGLKGYANIRYILDKNIIKDVADRASAEQMLQEFLHSTFSSVDADEYTLSLDEKGVNEFLIIFDSLIDEEMRLKAKNLSGCSSYEEFTASGTLQQKQALIVSIIDRIKLVD